VALVESKTRQTKSLAIIALIGAVVTAGAFLDPAQLTALGLWLDQNRSVAAIVLVICHVLTSLLVLPSWVFIALAGYLFGIPLGLGLAYISTVTACVAVFGVGRLAARDWVQRRLRDSRTLAALDKAVTENGFFIVLLTRLSLVLPLNLLNYSYSVTGVSVVQYVTGTAIGMIPTVAVYAFLGASVGDISSLLTGDYQGLNGGWLIWVSLAIAVGVTVWVARLTNVTLKRHLLDAEALGPDRIDS
jgi:uncharacterized membrane protein YdjX (TVP38/TMEM64 family)